MSENFRGWDCFDPLYGQRQDSTEGSSSWNHSKTVVTSFPGRSTSWVAEWSCRILPGGSGRRRANAAGMTAQVHGCRLAGPVGRGTHTGPAAAAARQRLGWITPPDRSRATAVPSVPAGRGQNADVFSAPKRRYSRLLWSMKWDATLRGLFCGCRAEKTHRSVKSKLKLKLRKRHM